jgi:hypothetical protein
MNKQLTLGELITFLEQQPESLLIEGLDHADSYRRYPDQLAFSLIGKKISVKKLLETCKEIKRDARFEGYKGGNYLMDENTPLWVANYGECGTKLIKINNDGSLDTLEE